MKSPLKKTPGQRLPLVSNGGSEVQSSTKPTMLSQAGPLGKCPDSADGNRGRYAFLLTTLAAAVLWFALVLPAEAAPGSCVEGPPGVITCTGNHSQGIASGEDFASPPATTLHVHSLSLPIEPAGGVSGISFSNSSGENIIINSGTGEETVSISTAGDDATGISGEARGISTTEAEDDDFLGVPEIGGNPTVPGGYVEINSYSDISTNGKKAHGIYSYSASGGYSETVINKLQNFKEEGFTFEVIEVRDPEEEPIEFDPDDTVEVRGYLIGEDGNPLTDSEGNIIEHGTFVIGKDGTYTVSFSDDEKDEHDALVTGESLLIGLDYTVKGERNSTSRQDTGHLFVVVHRTDTGDLEEAIWAEFDDFGLSTKPADANPTIFPDLESYVSNMLAEAIAGGSGGSVTVNSDGTVETSGEESHGIYAYSVGGKGAPGKNSKFYLVYETEPTPGEDGKSPGPINVTADGAITTHQDESSGISAVSNGGDGGDGGDGVAYRDGRLGGTGGDGGTVEVHGSADITTEGNYSSGILALSFGGAGGAGGSTGGVMSGGNGGYGGKGGTVTIDGSWTITTEGDKAHGIWAKSLGGSAGPGGSGGWLYGNPGSGGEASDGGSVTVVSGGAINTLGNESYGIYAQSVGGAGGTGTSGFSLLWSRGGDGGSAGSGGSVAVTNEAEASIITKGDSSHAIVAQSIGGGGGGGGGIGSLLASVGGSGGAGGDGGSVTVTNHGVIETGVIETSGVEARGIFAQSIGGGGGDSGTSFALISIGGSADEPSHGGDVTIENTGEITTRNNNADAVFAESIGGGGGSGSNSTGAISIGGWGAGGGSGGKVDVTNSGSIVTQGETSRGIFAHSVGGGGGSGAGGMGVVAVGGSGAGSGNGGHVEVTVTDSGSISTQGNTSDGIFAQSVGGGGGSAIGWEELFSGPTSGFVSIGGSSTGGGNGGSVTVTNNGMITTEGDTSHGIFAESIGGGGGRANFTNSQIVTIGGSGGTGGSGGSVTVTNNGTITTSGAGSHGVFAHSLGGGGGSGGLNLSFIVNIGGSGGASGDGGEVKVTNDGNINTQGDESHGIFAQSVGGGGGSIFTDDGALDLSDLSIDAGLLFSLGGETGGTGSGGNVTVTNNGDITTEGKTSDGIFAQSIGGGGGIGSFIIGAVGVEVDSTIGNDGDGHGGTVEVTNNGTIATQGENSDGIFAQSVGGGGGDGRAILGLLSLSFDSMIGNEGSGNGGPVTVTNNGSISTMGLESRGILAQSIGGSGGKGTVAGAFSIGPQFSSAAALGGGGGGGGDGGDVTVTNNGDITTEGATSDGIAAQSVGGGGGIGGSAISFSQVMSLLDFFNFNSNVSVGGTGGGGGGAGAVKVDNYGLIETEGVYSRGILAQSVGGGGGSGGSSTNITYSVNTNFNRDWGIGGSGGNGGSGGTVTIDNSGSIGTLGDNSDGILAQSVGGGGGNGGENILISADVKVFLPDVPGTDQIPLPDISGSHTASIGGTGGTGGSGGNVTVTNGESMSINTEGAYSNGIVAQSVGGGGGNGGNSVFMNYDISVLAVTIPTEWKDLIGLPSLKGSYSSSIGGSGGSGGKGGTVDVDNFGLIETQADYSNGILAQSVGGGGGNGGYSETISLQESIATASIKLAPEVTVAYSSSIGGSGGDGGNGGSVTVENSGNISTLGDNSNGILAQSVGGGGGNAGSSITFSADQKYLNFTSPSLGISYAESIGGSAVSGGQGGAVNVDNSGLIETQGVYSSGILAQSVGGGGGNGGFSTTVNSAQGILNESLLDVKVSVSSSVGGSGGNGGDGGSVTVTNSGNILTLGDHSYGILAQSVGGGGGNAGSTISVSTEQGFMNDTSPNLGASIESSIGGQGGGGGDGGTVSADNSNTIWTIGSFSSGILAQSVGGGGGKGAANLNVGADQNNLQNIADLSLNFDLKMSLSIGGSQGGSGNGGDVTVTNSGNIVTEGIFSRGIVAQSIGGGGGLGGYVATMEVTAAGIQILGSGGLDIELKGNNGSSGNGGDVTVTNSGNIVTEGIFSHGIVAQSIGGGGGLVGISNELGVTTTSFGSNMQGVLINTEGLGLSFAGSVGGNGSGGSVEVNNNGNIITQGDDSHGIFAQSAGGTGSGGSISVTHSGNIQAEGADSDGILAQSAGGTGGGDISVNILGGTVRGGSGTGAAVRFLEGSTNTLTSYGTITSKDGVAGNAIIGTSGNDTIHNHGTVNGTVNLGMGTNAFHNSVNATFNSGTVVNVGAGDMLTNAGTLSPGGQRNPVTTTLTGNFAQSSSGTFEVEVYGDGRHDKLDVDGDSASLDGTLMVTRGRRPYINGTRYDIIEVKGPAGISGAFSDLRLPEPKPLLRFGVNQLPNTVEVEVYAPKSTIVAKNRVGFVMGHYLDRIMPTATGDLANVLGEFQTLSSSEFGTAFSSLSPDSYDNYTRSTLFTTQQYTKSLQYRMNNIRYHVMAGTSNHETPIRLAYSGSNASLGQLFTPGEFSQVQGKNGIWLDGFGQWGDQDEEDGFTGYDYFIRGVTLGFDRGLSDNLMAGLSLGYSSSDIDLDQDRGSGCVRSFFGSLYGSYFNKNLYVDAILSYGRNGYDNSRSITIGGISRQASSEHDAHLFSGYLGSGYYFDFNPWSVGPYASLQYVRLDEESFEETGAGGISLRVEERQTDALVSELGLRMVGRFKGKDGDLLPEASLAWNYDFDIDDHVVKASFAGSPGSSFSMEGQDVEKHGVILGAGLTFIHHSGFSTSLRYRGEFREGYHSNGVMGEIRYTF